MNGQFQCRERASFGWEFDWKFRDLVYKVVAVEFSSLTFENVGNSSRFTVQRGDWSYIRGGGFELLWLPYCGHVTVEAEIFAMG